MNSQNNIKNRFYIQTLGCKVNQYESQAMREILLKSGFSESLSKDLADIYILNTCTVTHHADRECRYLVGMLHRANPDARIVVAGCYVEKNAEDISSLPGVRHVVKNSEKNRIADILRAQEPKSKIAQVADAHLSITGFKDRTKAFVKIQDGCENRCSYCKVPLVRSVLKSKPLDKVVEEVKTLTASGFKEIVLTGICLGAWGRDLFPPEIAKEVGLAPASLVDVLKALEKLEGDFRIRLSSIELNYVTDELVELISKSKKVCRHLHIPLQSGDDSVLKRMNRPYNAAKYRNVICGLARKMEDVAISTDVMVGFPGESNENFQNTVALIKSIMPARTHIFTFSRRDGTSAFSMGPEILESVVHQRYDRLKDAARVASYFYRIMFMNKKLEILVETKRDKKTGLLTGYSGNYIKVLFDGPDGLKGKLVPVKVTEVTEAHTKGIYEPA